jgi:hypothetical protein
VILCALSNEFQSLIFFDGLRFPVSLEWVSPSALSDHDVRLIIHGEFTSSSVLLL